MTVTVYDSKWDLTPSILDEFEIDDITDLDDCFEIINEEEEWIGVVLK